MRKIILASGSPRRKELLTQIGLEFTVVPAKGEEIIRSAVPSEAVTGLSLQKASEIAAITTEPAIIIGADTIVALNSRIMGKPKDKTDAFDMLKRLQDNTHSVYTGVTIIVNGSTPHTITFYEETSVTMYAMSDSEIEAYIETGEPMDKAGAYAIQGQCAAYIRKINGDYNNVVGLPLAHVYQILKTLRLP